MKNQKLKSINRLGYCTYIDQLLISSYSIKGGGKTKKKNSTFQSPFARVLSCLLPQCKRSCYDIVKNIYFLEGNARNFYLLIVWQAYNICSHSSHVTQNLQPIRSALSALYFWGALQAGFSLTALVRITQEKL